MRSWRALAIIDYRLDPKHVLVVNVTERHPLNNPAVDLAIYRRVSEAASAVPVAAAVAVSKTIPAGNLLLRPVVAVAGRPTMSEP